MALTLMAFSKALKTFLQGLELYSIIVSMHCPVPDLGFFSLLAEKLERKGLQKSNLAHNEECTLKVMN